MRAPLPNAPDRRADAPETPRPAAEPVLQGHEPPRKKAFVEPALTPHGSVPELTFGSNIFGD